MCVFVATAAGFSARQSPRGGAAAPSSGVAGQQFTGLAARVLSRPSAVRGTDGRFHIAYELVLTNMTQFAVDVERVEVRDARTHRVLQSLAGRALSSRMNPVAESNTGRKPADPTLMSSSGSSIVWFDVIVRRNADVPGVLEHLVVASTRPPKAVRFSSLVGRVSLRSGPPVVLGPPVRSGIWLAMEGCCDFDTHHRRGLLTVDGNMVVPQRFAVDWIMLDRQHRAWVGNPARLSSYFSYGQPEIAVAAGTIVVARDGIPNSPPPHDPTPPPLARLTGNYVELRVSPGIYVTYAHMKPGSVRVHVGQHVRRGQLLGELGNSGNSATPHLHLQVQITPSFVSDGLPYVFSRFHLLGEITEPVTDSTLGLRPNGKLPFAPALHPGTRRLEMPLNLNVVRFSEAR
jgi:Peptidase family M23